MKKGRLSEYLELETVEFQDQCIVGGRSRSLHSWFRYYDEILSSCRRNRQGFLVISFVALIVLVPIASLKTSEETQTGYNALHLFEEGRYSQLGCNYYCCGGGRHLDPPNMPFDLRVDRFFCENDFKDADWAEDIHNSEILRCYNLTYRNCVPDINTDVPDNDEDKRKYGHDDCAYKFFEHDGSLYSISGSLMPESFKAKCQETLQWRYVHYVSPETGCGADVPLRFCNCNGTINMDFLTGDGPFNCREFEIADLYKQGSEDDDVLEGDCKRERQKRRL